MIRLFSLFWDNLQRNAAFYFVAYLFLLITYVMLRYQFQWLRDTLAFIIEQGTASAIVFSIFIPALLAVFSILYRLRIENKTKRDAVGQWYIGRLNSVRNYLCLNVSTLHEWWTVQNSFFGVTASDEPASLDFVVESAQYQYTFMHEVASPPDLLPETIIREYASIRDSGFRGKVVILDSELERFMNFFAAETYKVKKFFELQGEDERLPDSVRSHAEYYVAARAHFVANLFERCHEAVSRNQWKNVGLNYFSEEQEFFAFRQLNQINPDIEIPKRFEKKLQKLMHEEKAEDPMKDFSGSDKSPVGDSVRRAANASRTARDKKLTLESQIIEMLKAGSKALGDSMSKKN